MEEAQQYCSQPAITTFTDTTKKVKAKARRAKERRDEKANEDTYALYIKKLEEKRQKRKAKATRKAHYAKMREEQEAAISVKSVGVQVDQVNAQVDDILSRLGPDDLAAFTDGSFRPGTNYISSAAKVWTADEWLQWGTAKPFDSSWITDLAPVDDAEVLAALWVLEQAERLNKHTVHLFFDGLILQTLASGERRPNTPIQAKYVTMVRSLAQTRMLHYIKVKSHSGVTENHAVDRLARNTAKWLGWDAMQAVNAAAPLSANA